MAETRRRAGTSGRAGIRLFERSKIPLSKWLTALFLLTSSKKGVSAHQIHRSLDISYKSAWFTLCCGGDFATMSTARSKRCQASGSISTSFCRFGGAMTLSDDPWIAEHSIIDPERLHALGMITLWWNHCERNLFFLFCIVMGCSPRVGWILAHDLGDISISTKIKEMLKLRPPDSDADALLRCCLQVYDVCRQNRNSLTHFTASVPSRDADAATLTAASFVRIKGPSPEASPLPSSLNDIRRVAIEVHYLAVYLWKIYKALVARGEGKPATLPPLIAAPELLWKPPQSTAPKQKRPPKPSRASRRKKR
jgi:hypothetical protein